jgi:hypothetical protein
MLLDAALDLGQLFGQTAEAMEGLHVEFPAYFPLPRNVLIDS